MIAAKSLNHIGIAVHSIEESSAYYKDVLGARFEGIEVVAEQKVRVGFFSVGPEPHGIRIELLEPTAEDSPIAKFLAKKGPGVHHLAFTVDGIEKRLESLEDAGIELIDKRPRGGAHHTRIAFLHPRSTEGILTEICEPTG